MSDKKFSVRLQNNIILEARQFRKITPIVRNLKFDFSKKGGL